MNTTISNQLVHISPPDMQSLLEPTTAEDVKTKIITPAQAAAEHALEEGIKRHIKGDYQESFEDFKAKNTAEYDNMMKSYENFVKYGESLKPESRHPRTSIFRFQEVKGFKPVQACIKRFEDWAKTQATLGPTPGAQQAAAAAAATAVEEKKEPGAGGVEGPGEYLDV